MCLNSNLYINQNCPSIKGTILKAINFLILIIKFVLIHLKMMYEKISNDLDKINLCHKRAEVAYIYFFFFILFFSDFKHNILNNSHIKNCLYNLY